VLHQHRLALPGAADDDVRAAAFDVEIDTTQNVLRPVRVVQAANPEQPALVALSERIPRLSGVGAGR